MIFKTQTNQQPKLIIFEFLNSNKPAVKFDKIWICEYSNKALAKSDYNRIFKTQTNNEMNLRKMHFQFTIHQKSRLKFFTKS